MGRRFDAYKVARGDNLGDPEFWNARLEDLDLRLAGREADGERIEGALDEVQAAALIRLDETFTPLVQEMLDQLANIGVVFSAASDTEHTIGTGEKVFVVAPADRIRFVTTAFVVIRPPGSATEAMFAAVNEYDRDTGLLSVTSQIAVGSGTFDDWEIIVSPPPDVGHASRTDNPHSVTKAQVGLGNADNTSDVNKPISTTAQNALYLKAPLDSPALIGTPTAPTQSAGNNTTRLANTAFVQAAITALINAAPGALDTLDELAAALGDDANFAATLTAALALKAPLASPALTNIPTAPTAEAGTNTTQIATTAFARRVLASALAGVILSGGILSNAADATNDIGISACVAVSDDGTEIISIAAITKRLDAGWVVGHNQGGLDTGSIANGTYHMWGVKRTDTGVSDAIFSASASAPTLPAGYTKKVYLGPIVRVAGAIKGFTQRGNSFEWKSPAADVDATNPGGSAVTRTLTVPTGIEVRASISIRILQTAQADVMFTFNVNSLSATDQASGNWTVVGEHVVVTGGIVNFYGSSVAEVWTNTSAQIRTRAEQSAAGTTVRIATREFCVPIRRLA